MKGNINKKAGEMLLELQVNWLSGGRGILSAWNVGENLRVSLTKENKLETDQCWSPEYLFLASVSSGFVKTYISMLSEFNATVTHLECNAIGCIKNVEGLCYFETIDLYPDIYIREEADREKAILAFKKTQTVGLISNSIKTAIRYHPEVSLESQRNAHPGGPLPKVEKERLFVTPGKEY